MNCQNKMSNMWNSHETKFGESPQKWLCVIILITYFALFWKVGLSMLLTLWTCIYNGFP